MYWQYSLAYCQVDEYFVATAKIKMRACLGCCENSRSIVVKFAMICCASLGYDVQHFCRIMSTPPMTLSCLKLAYLRALSRWQKQFL